MFWKPLVMSTAIHTSKAELLVGKIIDINECRHKSGSDPDICGIVDVKSESELKNEMLDIEDPIKYPVMRYKLKIPL